MLKKPRWLLHLEGASILALTLILYRAGHFDWRLFALLFLAPDLSLLGYLWNTKVGSALYHLVHTTSLPLLWIVAYGIAPLPSAAPYAFLIWLARPGLDGMAGYGLQYPTQFRGEHLQRA